MAISGAKPVKLYYKNSTTKKWTPWDGVLSTGDIEIGAVEIKDHDSDDRAEVTSDNALRVDQHTATAASGAPVTIGTSAVELTFTGKTRAITVKSASTNTGLIWLGASNVDNTGANAYGELTADSAVSLSLNDASSAVYAVSDTAAQTVYKAALT